MIKYVFIICLFFLVVSTSTGQKDSLASWKFMVAGDFYYSIAAGIKSSEKPSFLYNHKRNNELNINLVAGKVSYHTSGTKINLGLMAGNYVQYNLSHEPAWARLLYEANIGIRLSKKHETWIEAGIMPSHIGFESVIGADNWTLSRSMAAENSPYYETGIKCSFQSKNKNFMASLLMLNGWQMIQKADNINTPSWGCQIQYTIHSNLMINYSNFFGSVLASNNPENRFFQNIYLQYAPETGFGLIVGFDAGFQSRRQKEAGIWYTPVAVVRYVFTRPLKIAFRGEWYSDKREVMINTADGSGFAVAGASFNLDYHINSLVLARAEGRLLKAREHTFSTGEKYYSSLSLALNFLLKE